MTGRVAGVPPSRIAFVALTRTFLRRFFDNEITGGTRDLTESLFWLVGFLAAPLALMPVGDMFRYRLIVLTRGPAALRILSRPDKTFAIVLGMMAAALVAAVVWSSLTLERRDGLILGALPVQGRTVVLAKLAALAMYVFGIAVAMHAVSSLIYGLVLADGAGFRFLVLSPVAHFTAAVTSCAFVFLSITAVQGVALVLTGPGGFRRGSAVLQAALVAGIVVALTKIPAIVGGVGGFNQAGRATLPAHWLMFAPPVWFLGLDEWMLGGAEPVYGRLALTAALAFATVGAITLATYALVYRRVMVRAVETPEDSGGSWRVSATFDWVTRRIARRQVTRASAQFLFTSIGRVERLRFVVAVMAGVVCAWIVPALTVIAAPGGAPLSPRATFALSYAALMLVIVGLRIAIAMPADLRAAWIVPMIDAPARLLRSGLWRALFVTSVLPVSLAFAVFLAWRGDARMALVHAVVMIAVGVPLVELALWHFDDLPHRRPWRPEHANLRVWWPAYITGFLTLTGTLPKLEWAYRDSLAANAFIAGVCLSAALVLRIAHRRPYPAPPFDIETFVEPLHVLKLE